MVWLSPYLSYQDDTQAGREGGVLLKYAAEIFIKRERLELTQFLEPLLEQVRLTKRRQPHTVVRGYASMVTHGMLSVGGGNVTCNTMCPLPANPATLS